jgi:hypothetical protein
LTGTGRMAGAVESVPVACLSLPLGPDSGSMSPSTVCAWPAEGRHVGESLTAATTWLEDAIEAPEQDERQDDSAVLGPLVVAAQQIGDGPDQAGVVVGR